MQGLCKKAKEMHQLNPEVDVTTIVKLPNGDCYVYSATGDAQSAILRAYNDGKQGKCIQIDDEWFSVRFACLVQ